MSDLKGKSVQVTNPIEYGMALASYMIAGANVWPWHKGYKPLDNEDSHHVYAWEDCGFLKQAGVFETMKGDFGSPVELINVVRDEIEAKNEHLRLKEEECKQLAEDKLKLAKFISSIQMCVGDEVRMESLFEELGLDELVRGA